jgi:hypothetical protein
MECRKRFVPGCDDVFCQSNLSPLLRFCADRLDREAVREHSMAPNLVQARGRQLEARRKYPSAIARLHEGGELVDREKCLIRPPSFSAENATTWLIPRLVGEVKFTEWTSEGEMRHPAFLGLRSDKKALDVIRERT